MARASGQTLLRWAVWLLAVAGAFPEGGTLRAQAVTTATGPGPAEGRRAKETAWEEGRALAALVDDEGPRETGAGEDGEHGASCPAPGAGSGHAARVVMGPCEVIRESMFGAASAEDWRPLSLRTFFSEGWDEPYARAPAGTNGAPKQNWVGTPAGVFGRYVDTGFLYTNNLTRNAGLFINPSFPFLPVKPSGPGNQYAGYSVLLLPVNSRLAVLLGTVFIASNKAGPGGGYAGNWGDTGIQARFHLVEQRNLSVVATLGERIPTGRSVNGSAINFVTPGLEFWWNFAPSWVLRGSTAVNILTAPPTRTTVYANQLSVGRYLTGKDARTFKNLVVHLTADVLSDVAGNRGYIDDVYIEPGFRFGLGKEANWGVLAGLLVPVAGPQPFDYQTQFSITRSF